MQTLYARKEPTTDHYRECAHKSDVAIYRDPHGVESVARYSWHNGRKPDRRFRRVMMNCTTYRLEWLSDEMPEYPRIVARTPRSEYWEIAPGKFNICADPGGGNWYPALLDLMRMQGDYVAADYGFTDHASKRPVFIRPA